VNSDDKFISRPDGLLLNLSGLGPGQIVGAGRFKLRRLLGQGGMGVVWQAEDTRLGIEVALKFLPPVISHEAVALELIRAEVRRCLQLSHPNIVRIHDFHGGGCPEVFFSMEYVEGPTLGALRVQQAPKVLAWEFLAPLVLQLCNALQYAHDEKVVHRDLKPSNLMVDAKGRLKLADFGVSRALSQTLSTVTGSARVGGTLPYMGPQQLGGGNASVADDVYSLGATLYELLTSQPPFVGGDISYQVMQVQAQPLAERLKQLSLANPLPSEVGTTVASCLSKDPSARPRDAREIAERLRLTWAPAQMDLSSSKLESGVSVSQWARKSMLIGGIALLLVCGIWGLGKALRRTQGAPPKPGQPWENSLGMRFNPVGNVLFSIWETRVQDYETFVRRTHDQTARPMESLGLDGWAAHGHSWKDPGYAQLPTHPVVGMKWDDAVQFCAWLTEEERRLGWIGSQQRYRLPTDEEWSQAVAEDTMQYPWGNDRVPPAGAGNYAGAETKEDPLRPVTREYLEYYSDRFTRAAPVGSFSPNRFGLYDLGGNVLEWCDDIHPVSPTVQLLRGASWDSGNEEKTPSTWRINVSTGYRSGEYGFRCVLELSPPTPVLPVQTDQSDHNPPPLPAFTNSLGLRFVRVGDVLMSVCETRVKDFAAFAQATGHDSTKVLADGFGASPFTDAGHNWRSPGFPQADNHPVVGVHVRDALAFCNWLTDQDSQAGMIQPPQRYRLPTDEEWSEAADAKAWKFPWGNHWPPPTGAGNYANLPAAAGGGDFFKLTPYTDAFAFTAPVQSFHPNPRGFYDLGGNVAELCQGRRGNPAAVVARGGSWRGEKIDEIQSTYRLVNAIRSEEVGFRCVLESPESRP
jgi:serine/threonine protein kinase/formylglycine-generating enzyme required for sulfatase activity